MSNYNSFDFLNNPYYLFINQNFYLFNYFQTVNYQNNPISNFNNKLIVFQNDINYLKKKREREISNCELIPFQTTNKLNNNINNNTNLENQNIEKQNEIIISLKKENEEDENKKKDSNSNNENEIKPQKKKKRTSYKRNNDEELLQDSFLNHIGKPYSNPIRFFREELPKRKNYNKKNNVRQKNKEEKLNSTIENPIKGIKRVVPLKITKINFYGNEYKKTNSPAEFMKYNFDFTSKEQYKTERLIVNKEKQVVDLNKLIEKNEKNDKKNENNENNDKKKNNNNIYNKKNSNEILPQKLYDPNKIKDFNELNKNLNIIEKFWPKHIYRYSEDIALNFLKENDYSLDKFVDYFKSDEFKSFLKLIKKQSSEYAN